VSPETGGDAYELFAGLWGGLRDALPRTWQRPRWRFASIAVVALVPVFYVGYCIVTIPFSGGLSIQPTPSALVVEADDGRAFATRGIFKGEKLSPDQIPAILASAVIAIEDRRFYQHGGIDFAATVRSMPRLNILVSRERSKNRAAIRNAPIRSPATQALRTLSVLQIISAVQRVRELPAL
jgi:Transglycosylase